MRHNVIHFELLVKHNVIHFEPNEYGWIVKCACGWTDGVFPNPASAIDAYGDHRAATSHREATS